jgi:hypothetical protein
VFAGRDVSDEVTTSPVEVGAIAFEDDHGGVRIFLTNWNDRPREVELEFRGQTMRRRLLPGALAQLTVFGRPVDMDATPPDADVRGAIIETAPAR